MEIFAVINKAIRKIPILQYVSACCVCVHIVFICVCSCVCGCVVCVLCMYLSIYCVCMYMYILYACAQVLVCVMCVLVHERMCVCLDKCVQHNFHEFNYLICHCSP